ncbi:MAG: helix-turn-helix domain-containing protein [Candidatus Limnocylindria bacterium]
MDALRLGTVFRSVRLRKGWRQLDVAGAARVSIATISRIERGAFESVSVGILLRVAAALEIRVDWMPRWRGGELDRMLNAGHAAMHEAAAVELAGTEWLTAAETTFAVYGERGIIDILCFHPPTRALLVIELKTDLVDVQALIGAVDRYRRLAPQVARERGWSGKSVSCWVLLRDTPSNHRRLSAHATVLRNAFPVDGRRMRGWLRHPLGTVAALSFLSDSHARKASGTISGVQRVRVRKLSVGAAANRHQFSAGENPIGSNGQNAI